MPRSTRLPTSTGIGDFFQQLIDTVSASVDAAGADLIEMDSFMPAPPELAPEDEAEPADWARSTCDYLSEVGDRLPDEAGSLVLVVEPGTVGSREAMGWSFGALAYWIRSDRAKVVVVDGGPAPLVPVSSEVEPRMVRVDFAVPPEELEQEVLDELDSDDLDPSQALRLQLLAGAFASAGGRFDEAEMRLNQALTGSVAGDAGGDRANVLYNLGNLHAQTGRYPDASATLAQAAEAALEGENTPLAAMALTNLGLSLYHEHRGQEALDTLGTARRLFQSMNHCPGEAYVVDCTAQIWAPSNPELARSLWNEALSLYDSIEAPHLHEVRSGGRADVLEKLGRLPTVPGAGR